jgi:CheY-like chemotaxis protein
MKKVLVVDDEQKVLALLKKEIEKHDYIAPYFAHSYKDALNLLSEHQGEFHAALLDINLPDAKNKEIVELATFYNIPSVILTDINDEKIEDTFLQKDILNIISKNDLSSIVCAVNDISRTLKNYDTSILIVRHHRYKCC